MSRITQLAAVGPFSLFQVDTDASAVTYTGQRFYTSDGRELVLVKAGALDLGSGLLMQGSAIVTNHQNLAVVANTAAGATQVTVTLGATLSTVNQYQQGWAIVNAGPGQGQILKIQTNPATALSQNMVVTLEDPIITALTTSSKICLIADIYRDVIINPVSATNQPVGVTLYPIAATKYGYIQTRGIVSALNDAGTTVGLGIAPSTNTAGALMTVAATTNQVGAALQAGVTTESRAVFLNM